MAFVPDADPIAEVELGETADIAGGALGTTPSGRSTATTAAKGKSGTSAFRTPPATSAWRSGATRRIRTLHRGTGAARPMSNSDGWQDDKEASASWNSTMSCLMTVRTGDWWRRRGSHAETTDAEHAGLSSFGDEGDDTDADRCGDEAAAVSAGTGDTSPDGRALSAGRQVEFTAPSSRLATPRTRRREQTMSVETGERVQLGQELTVRELRDDRLIGVAEAEATRDATERIIRGTPGICGYECRATVRSGRHDHPPERWVSSSQC